jgi:hypothetical protein
MSSILILSNWRVRYAMDKAYGKAISINKEMGIERKSIKPVQGGLYTPELGNVVDTDKDIREYSCFCGKLNSRLYENDVCPDCNTTCVEQFGYDLQKYGWLDLDPYYVIQPAAYELIQTVLGAKAFNLIINYQVNIGIEGALIPRDELSNVSKRKIGPYENIGLIEFKRRFVEIMTYYGRIKPNKLEKAMFLIQNRSRVFTNKIPVYSSLLRPAYASGAKKIFSYDKINAYYTSIINNIKLLKNGSSKRLRVSGPLVVLFSIQEALQQSYHATASAHLIGKTKVIRKTIMSTRTCFSSRAVITSLTGKYAGLDHIVLAYRQFLKLYTLEILNCMMRGIGNKAFMTMTLYELLAYVRRANYSEYCDEAIYTIINYLIDNHKQGLYVILSRPPILDLGSTTVMKVVHVTKDPKNETMKVPVTSLNGQTGDYDGDVEAINALKELQIMEAYVKGLNPRYLCVDRTGDSVVAKEFLPEKDQITSLCSFFTPLD